MTLGRAASVAVVAAGLLLVSGLGGGWWWTGRLAPRLSGEEQLTGLNASVQVDFDRYAVPHVLARGADDLWTAMGYLHGRERLWQMELYRRAAAGRLAELFGEQMLPLDRRFRRLGLMRAAEAELGRATPGVRSALERYAQGVDAAARAAGRWRLPAEFQALGASVGAWNPVDSLAIGKLMAWRLGENHLGELVRYALARKLTGGAVEELMGAPPIWAPTIVNGGMPRMTRIPRTIQAIRVMARGGTAPAQTGADPSRLPPGLRWLEAGRSLSNSWVVSGDRTATGRPLLANDPHLAVEMPALWYEAHLTATDLDVTGVTIPGSPFVIIGHNGRIGWGVTNVGADVQDFTIEQVDEERSLYLNHGAWVPLRVQRHEIPVRGRAPEPFEVLFTERGPVARAELWDEPPQQEDAGQALGERPLSFRWDVIMHGDTAGAFEALGRAGDWQDFLAAVRRLGAPAQNFVYADVDGNIGYAMSGLVPARVSDDGVAPRAAPAADATNDDPRGFVDPATLPALFNPASGLIVAANNEVDRRFAHVITRDWVAPFRAARIHDVLGSRTGLDVTAFQALQSDRTSAAAALVLPAVGAAARRYADGPGVDVLKRLQAWDRRVDGRPVVALYETFLTALWRLTFADELGDALFQRFYRWAAHERYAGLYMILDDPSSRWWDDVTTTDARENRNDIVARAAEEARRVLDRQLGPESSWAWDRLHAVKFAHPLGQGGRVLAWFFSRGPIPSAGDGTTVNKSTVDWDAPYAAADVASYRQILDVGAWDESLGVITTGQSGHPRSPHYFDQNPLWRDGRYHALPYSRQAVEDARVSRLLLVPRR